MQVKTFNGLNNVGDPLGLGLSWLASAENVNITAASKIERREGYSLATPGAFSSGYATLDEQRGYLVEGGTLKTIEGETLLSGLATDEMHWTELNGVVYFNNGVDRGQIGPDNGVLDWAWPVPGVPTLSPVTGALPAGQYQVCCTFTLADGRETGPGDGVAITLSEGQALQVSGIPQAAGAHTNVYIAPANETEFMFADTPLSAAMVWNQTPDNLGMYLQTGDAYPIPSGCSLIQAWRGRIYVAMYDASRDQTVVWFTQALGYHLVNLASDYLLINGHLHMMAPHKLGLVLGTDRAIYAYDGTNLDLLASYGVVPGHHWAHDGDADAARLIFWSRRGACTALPFLNLTGAHHSAAPGLHAAGAVLETGGENRYVVALQQGGTAFNPRV